MTSPEATKPDAPLCTICSKLDLNEMMRVGVYQDDAIPLGPLTQHLSNAQNNICGLCRLISRAITHIWLLDQHPNVDLSNVQVSIYCWECGYLDLPSPPHEEMAQRLYFLAFPRPAEIHHANLASHGSMQLEAQLLEEDASRFGRKADIHGRRMNDTVDVSRVQEWLRYCEENHGVACNDVWWMDFAEPLPSVVRFVDVIDLCLVPGELVTRYIALSYVWGKVSNEYWTMQDNLERRCSPGGIDVKTVPDTIVDAINFTRQLGERYIWIDALCIVQDSLDDKMAQIGKMDLIYGRSFLTLFATGGDSAYAPLPGVRAGSREVNQKIEKIQGLHFANPLPTMRRTLNESVWSGRGWTYQEHMLSRRRLFFTKHQVDFECRVAGCREDVVTEGSGTYAMHPGTLYGSGALMGKNKPRAQSRILMRNVYMSMVMPYTRRKLTNEGDIVIAVSALANAITKAYELGEPEKAFRFGMLMCELDSALLWQPTARSPFERRSDLPGGLNIPSWAWTGWRQEIQYEYIEGWDVGLPAGSLVTDWHIVAEDKTLTKLDVKWISYGDRVELERERAITLCGPPVSRQGHKIPHSNLVPGSLVFRSSSAQFCIMRASKEKDENRITYPSHPEGFSLFYIMNVPRGSAFRILDRVFSQSHGPAESNEVGSIILPTNISTDEPLELILLSRSGRTDPSRFNVMAVKGIEFQLSMRVGVGFVYEKAWREARPKERVVQLG